MMHIIDREFYEFKMENIEGVTGSKSSQQIQTDL